MDFTNRATNQVVIVMTAVMIETSDLNAKNVRNEKNRAMNNLAIDLHPAKNVQWILLLERAAALAVDMDLAEKTEKRLRAELAETHTRLREHLEMSRAKSAARLAIATTAEVTAAMIEVLEVTAAKSDVHLAIVMTEAEIAVKIAEVTMIAGTVFKIIGEVTAVTEVEDLAAAMTVKENLTTAATIEEMTADQAVGTGHHVMTAEVMIAAMTVALAEIARTTAEVITDVMIEVLMTVVTSAVAEDLAVEVAIARHHVAMDRQAVHVSGAT